MKDRSQLVKMIVGAAVLAALIFLSIVSGHSKQSSAAAALAEVAEGAEATRTTSNEGYDGGFVDGDTVAPFLPLTSEDSERGN
jgi:hypothetical protein